MDLQTLYHPIIFEYVIEDILLFPNAPVPCIMIGVQGLRLQNSIYLSSGAISLLPRSLSVVRQDPKTFQICNQILVEVLTFFPSLKNIIKKGGGFWNSTKE